MADDAAIDTAWRIHSAIVDWTGKVDSKASFALAIESAVMAGVVSLTGDSRRLSHLEDWPEQVAFWVGVGLLASALLAVAWVVRPRLRSREVALEWRENFIYFGHVRKWDPKDLEKALEEKELLPILSRQLVSMSQLAWRKHKLLQWSMVCAVVGTGVVAVAALWNG